MTLFRYHPGFTLLELVLVLFILAILTTTGLTFIENEDGQLRFDESLNKLDLIADALLKERVHKNSTVYAGFVSDNGRVPDDTDLSPLTSNDTGWSQSGSDEWISYGEITPYYFNIDGVGVIQQLDDTDNPEFNLYKGFRGPYLVAGIDSNNNFFDGWGNSYSLFASTFSSQFDYTFQRSSSTIPSTFNGSDITKSLSENEWTITPSALNITINNNTASNDNVNLAVVVFLNSSVSVVNEEDRWVTFHFDANQTVTAGNSFSSSSATWEINGNSLTSSDRIPVGEHLVLLIDGDITGAAIDGVTEIDDSSRFTVFAGTANQPEITLEIQ